ncbi:helix-turn-helix domain-containing protein [Gordonibacter sp. RACS_AR68]|uniref:helix-turn-helix domain-containing protein n=1 Tax=Gordonibacter sp. RACS_AR68 TaxID=2872005 RepID=UPI002619BDD6|nr:helix-turn-helix domain-containing protein [Gordonibacter sp. RACS_AR68]MDN4471346.1 helix-turn-helix domain-containing protein [Gordonibacter sp. RACS_AR68]
MTSKGSAHGLNDFEKAFNEEVRDKKRTANGVHGRTGKRGYVGAVKTPADLLKGKERRQYEGTSPVTVSSIYDHIIPHDEFKSLSRKKKMILLYEYKKRFTAKEIAEKWDISDKTIYYYYRAYGVTSGDNPAPDAEEQQSSQAKEAADTSPSENIPPALPAIECSFVMTGKYDGQSLGKKLGGLSYMMGDHLKYQVEIRIKELS